MIDAQEVAGRVSRIEKLLAEKFGIKGVGLEQGLRKAGRRLPRRVRSDARIVVEAGRLSQHPRLARQLDRTRFQDAADRVTAHLKAIDVADRHKGAAISVLAGMAFNLLLLGVLLVAFSAWRGWI